MIDLLSDLEKGTNFGSETATTTVISPSYGKSKTPTHMRSKKNHRNKHFSGYYSNDSTKNGTTYDTSTTRDNDDTTSIVSMGNIEDIFLRIDTAIKEVDQASQVVNQLCHIKRCGLPSEQQSAMKKVDTITVTTTSMIHKVKNMMQEAEHVGKSDPNFSQTQRIWFQNMLNAMVKKYQQSILQFQQSTQNFKTVMIDDFVRQAKIVKPNISQKQIQIMIESPDPGQYLQQQIMAVDGELLDQIHDMEDEHEKLQKLEKTMLELQELFNSCAVLVSTFQEHLDIIEDNVDKTKIHVKKGKKQLKQGEVYVKQARKTRIKTSICCLLILIIIALVLLGPVLKLIPMPGSSTANSENKNVS